MQRIAEERQIKIGYTENGARNKSNQCKRGGHKRFIYRCKTPDNLKKVKSTVPRFPPSSKRGFDHTRFHCRGDAERLQVEIHAARLELHHYLFSPRKSAARNLDFSLLVRTLGEQDRK